MKPILKLLVNILLLFFVILAVLTFFSPVGTFCLLLVCILILCVLMRKISHM